MPQTPDSSTVGESPAKTDKLKFYDLPAGLHCPFYVSAMLLPPDRHGVRRAASGRGLSIAEARQKCAWEAAERSLAVYRPDVPMRRASYAEVRPHAVNPGSLILLSEKQYDRRAEWNAAVGAPHAWPDRFDPERPIAWSSGQNLDSGETILVPSATVFLGYDTALDEGFTIPDSNGLAVGKTRDDAITRALLEVVERDAAAMWWYNCAKRPALEVERDALPVLESFARWIDAAGRRFWLLDLTADLDIPVAAAVSCNHSGGDMAIGFGAGWSPAEAAHSALGELVQFDINKKMQRQSETGSAINLISLMERSTVDALPFLQPGALKGLRASRKQSGPQELVQRMTQLKLTPIVVDFTAQELFAVRVVVPGLRPLWPRFAAGRLYDVPVALGWTDNPASEQDLNPMPILY